MPNAPQAALDYLKANPGTSSLFEEKYGYLPDDFERPEAPAAAIQFLSENPTTAPQFKQKYGYLPAPAAAVDYLRANPATADQFKSKFGYLPKFDEGPTAKERGEAFLKDTVTGLLRLARSIPTIAIEAASRAQKRTVSPQRPLRSAEGIVGYQPPVVQDEYSDIERLLPEQALPDLQRSAEQVEKDFDGTIETIKESLPEAIKSARSGPIVTKDSEGKLDVHWENINIDVLSQLAAESIAYGGGVFKLGQALGGGVTAAGAANSLLISAETVHDTRQKIMTKLEKQGIRGEEAEVLANKATERAVQIIAPVAFVTGRFGEGAAIATRNLRQVGSAAGRGAGSEVVEEVTQMATPAIATGEAPKSEELAAAAILAPVAGGVQAGTISAAAAWDAQLKEKLATGATGGEEAAAGIPAAGEERRAEPTEGPRERRVPENQAKREETDSILRQLRATQADIEAGRAAPEALAPIAEKAVALLYKDDLTGLQNYRSFQEFAKENPDHQVMFMDLDDFKSLNTKYGHGGADQILAEVGRVMREIGEEMNVVPFRRAKQGAGDEFLAVAADPELLKTYGQRVQEALDSATLEVVNQKNERVQHAGIGSSHGIGVDEAAAEAAGNTNKQERKASGKRVGSRDTGEDTGAVQPGTDSDIPAAGAADLAPSTGVSAGGSAGGGAEQAGLGTVRVGETSNTQGGSVSESQPVTPEQIQAAKPNLPPEQRPSATAYAGVALDRAGEILVNATHKLMDKLGIAKDGVKVERAPSEDGPGPMSLIWSPSRLVKKYPRLAKYLNFARDSFEIQEGLRNAFRARLGKIDDVLKEGDVFGKLSDVYRQNKRTLQEIRLTEDTLGKRLTAQQMRDEFGARPAAIKAHMLMRAAYDHAWTILSKTRELRGKLPPSYREGYLPHMFHNYFVIHENPLPPGASGPPHSEIVGSGRTMAEAVAIGNQLRRFGGKGDIKIRQKQFKFPGEDVQAAVVGDIEYFQMQRKLEKNFELTHEEAQEVMNDLARRKGRSRFFGNLLERSGVKGWEQDLDWVDRRYFNMVARYAALDRFKSKAITAYEREFGKFEGDKKDLAQYVKEYINDINGTPTWVENILSNGLSKITPLHRFLGHYLGDRPILQLANGTANAVAIAKLGFLSPAAALINGSQLIGAYSLLGEKYFLLGNGLAMKAISGRGAGASTLRGILKQAGVDTDLGLESAAGYSGNAPLGKALNMTMIAFTGMEKYVRATTVLGAYRKACAGGASHKEAIEFAGGINERVNFNYGIIDTPNFIRRAGPVGTVIFQFKKFPVKMLELMLSHRREELARFWIPMFLIAGVYAFPGGEALKELIKAATSKNGYGGWDAELELKAWLTDWAGNDPEKQKWARVVMYGAFSLEPLGVDISRRVGGSDFIPTSPSDFAGAGPSSLWRSVQFSLQGEWAEALRAVATGPGNLAVALSQDKFSRSVTDRDRPIAEVTPGDVFKKAIGFRPYEEAKEVDVARLIAYENERYRRLQVEVVDGIIASVLRMAEANVAIAETAPAHDQAALRKDIKEEYDREIADIMKTIAKNGIIITPEQVQNEIKNKNLTRSQRAFLNASDVIKARTSRIYMFSQGSSPVRQGSGNAEE